MRKFQLEEHIRMLMANYRAAREDGDWDAVNVLGMSIDDSLDELERLTLGEAL